MSDFGDFDRDDNIDAFHDDNLTLEQLLGDSDEKKYESGLRPEESYQFTFSQQQQMSHAVQGPSSTTHKKDYTPQEKMYVDIDKAITENSLFSYLEENAVSGGDIQNIQNYAYQFSVLQLNNINALGVVLGFIIRFQKAKNSNLNMIELIQDLSDKTGVVTDDIYRYHLFINNYFSYIQ